MIRFSAMGDVAMTVPVIKNLLNQHPGIRITFVSNAFFKPMFDGIERCEFIGAELKTTNKGIGGIYQLYKTIKNNRRITAIADLHNSLRSRLIRVFYSFSGVKTSVIDKGRNEKKALTRKENKILVQLTPMHERYATVFRQLGIQVALNQDKPILAKQPVPAALLELFTGNRKTIGIAPFAQHTEKMYPVEKMKILVQQLAAQGRQIILFGSKEEAVLLEQWAKEINHVINIAGKFSFAEELATISQLDVMVSMDSANMHLASLYKVPVVSIWGATHPFAGFYGWAQDTNNIVSIDLYCRPCSVFGNKPCFRGDHACMMSITELMVMEKITAVLQEH